VVKYCPKCREVLPRSSFSSNRSRADGLQRVCRECQRAYVRGHYYANRQYYLEKALRSNRRHRELIRAELRRLKDVPCADCGVRYPPWVMQFDHVRGQKLFNLGAWNHMSTNIRTEQLLAEAAKCEIVCANCHHERTWQRWLARP
jgi:hypothetical protein